MFRPADEAKPELSRLDELISEKGRDVSYARVAYAQQVGQGRGWLGVRFHRVLFCLLRATHARTVDMPVLTMTDRR